MTEPAYIKLRETLTFFRVKDITVKVHYAFHIKEQTVRLVQPRDAHKTINPILKLMFFSCRHAEYDYKNVHKISIIYAHMKTHDSMALNRAAFFIQEK